MSTKRIYNTKQKDEILRCISGFGEAHFTAADVVSRLSAEGVSVGQATVYRFIDRLASVGKLRKYVVDGTTAACYQVINDGHHESCREHFHLKCKVCGRLIHVECEELRKIAEHISKDHGFAVDSSKTVFYGVCKDCKADK